MLFWILFSLTVGSGFFIQGPDPGQLQPEPQPIFTAHKDPFYFKEIKLFKAIWQNNKQSFLERAGFCIRISTETFQFYEFVLMKLYTFVQYLDLYKHSSFSIYLLHACVSLIC